MMPVRVYESAALVVADDCFQDSAKLFLSPEAMSMRRSPTFSRRCGVSPGQFPGVISMSKSVKMLKMRSPMRLPLSQIAFISLSFHCRKKRMDIFKLGLILPHS